MLAKEKITEMFNSLVKPNPSDVDDMIEFCLLPQHTDEERLHIRLEICDWINLQKRDGPLKAIESLLPKINTRNERAALEALAILDACAKNCGYPFHLQMASQKFLKGLTRSLPEKPPVPLSPTQQKILELLTFWRDTVCQKSRFKEDLVEIETMCQSLTAKGYRLPRIHVDPSLVIDDKVLATEEELQASDQKAHAAKLNELLRRGTPHDLTEANELMKIMAGYDFDKVPDYQGQVMGQLRQLDSDCQDSMVILNTLEPGDDPTAHPKLQELIGHIKASHPKIQKWIQEETDETKIEFLLKVNDQMNTATEVYNSLKEHLAATRAAQGPSQHYQAPSPQPAATRPPASAPAPKKNEEVSLIDLDFDDTSGAATRSQFSGFDALSASGSSQLSPSAFPSFALGSQTQTPDKIACVLYKNGLEVHMKFEPSQIFARYVNNLNFPMTEFSVQYAVPKTMKLRMESPSSSNLAPSRMGGAPVTQRLGIENPDKAPLRMLYKLSYSVNGQKVEEQGELENIPAF